MVLQCELPAAVFGKVKSVKKKKQQTGNALHPAFKTLKSTHFAISFISVTQVGGQKLDKVEGRILYQVAVSTSILMLHFLTWTLVILHRLVS